jgi:hypothetical protein
MFNRNKKKLRKLREFHLNFMMHKSEFSMDYIASKENEITMVEWLIAYYEGRAASTPKKLLETYIRDCGYYNNTFSIKEYERHCKCISVLYNWIYNDEIVGF